MAQENEGKVLTKKDLNHVEEWEQTRRLYSQLYLLSTMQNLLLARLEPRFRRHGMVLKQKSKYNFNRAHKLIQEAAKLLDDSEMEGSGMGKKGDDDFFQLNTCLNREGYFHLRCHLAIQNAGRYLSDKDCELIIDYLNGLTTGKKRFFPKKMIDTYKLEEDK